MHYPESPKVTIYFGPNLLFHVFYVLQVYDVKIMKNEGKRTFGI